MTETSGIILINKPAGPSSHDIVNYVRRTTGAKKVGHAGTLDPFAEGLLIILIGRDATKEQRKFLNSDKEYIATMKIGAETDTYDKTGSIMNVYKKTLPSEKEIRIILKSFIGKINQIPPSFSAKKIQGRRAYKLAREGKKIDLEPVEILIKKIALLNYDAPLLQLEILCSAGTYIRSLAHDIGQKLSNGAYLEKLTRTKIGKFKLEKALDIDKLTSKNWTKCLIDLEKK
ncbi:MAG: tRNA pseudouridine(55) synthase TruB [Candidatus Paceibacterota bacterium]|jgi:tRNA pseudouridine55 synthase